MYNMMGAHSRGEVVYNRTLERSHTVTLAKRAYYHHYDHHIYTTYNNVKEARRRSAVLYSLSSCTYIYTYTYIITAPNIIQNLIVYYNNNLILE
jgi:hypothetical protein